MNKFIVVAALACALFAGQTAEAGVLYQYRYTFADGAVVNGRFTGNAKGNLITDLSGISAYLNGAAFNGNGGLFAAGMDADYNWIEGAGVASFDGLQNSFLFADSNFPTDSNLTNYFYDNYLRTRDADISALHGSATDDLSSLSYAGANWQVTMVPPASEVPVPAPFALIGVAAAGLLLSRRRQY